MITDSIQPTEAVLAARNIRVLPIATLIGEAIGRTATEEVGVEPVRLIFVSLPQPLFTSPIGRGRRTKYAG